MSVLAPNVLFSEREVEQARQDPNAGSALKRLFETKTASPLSKRSLNKELTSLLIAEAEASGILPQRPILDQLDKITRLAATNHQPTSGESWETNQQSGYFGKKIPWYWRGIRKWDGCLDKNWSQRRTGGAVLSRQQHGNIATVLVDGLGFEMTKKWSPDGDGKVRWCWCSTAMPRSCCRSTAKKAPTHGRRNPEWAWAFSICFLCKDALALYKDFKSRGIEAKMPFVGNAMWVTSVQDPDGYKLEFESFTDVPEETVFSEG
jgi:lactoylglutathione lyase